jgi:UDP-N-acetylmuramoylalanine--D-glutamate ligase
MTNAQQQFSTLVVGLGKTGESCARYLHNKGVGFCVTDTRSNPPGLEKLHAELPGLCLHIGGYRDEDFTAADQIVLSPGVPRSESHVQQALASNVPVIGDIELFAQEVQAPVIAITGTNGKSTVTTLVGEMAREAGRRVSVGGNLGTPALDLLDADSELYVLELSSFQLESTFSLNAVAAVVLNVSPDHLDRYASVEDYVAAKQHVYHGDGVMIINRDDAIVAAMRDSTRRCISFGLDMPAEGDFGVCQHQGEAWLCYGKERWLAASDLKLPGRHNLANVLATLALGQAVDLPREAMVRAVRNFTGLAHRSEWIAEADGVNWYNDSKATNVGATVAALQGMPGPLVLIAGGDAKGAEFSALREAVRDKVHSVVLIGRDAGSIAAAIGDAAQIIHAADMHDAVVKARDLARPGDSVLLSPACASFDMFDNFMHRGEVFRDAVREVLS